MGSCNRIAAVMLLIFTINTPVWASFTLPGMVYRADQMSTAINDAKDKNIPILYLWSDENTTCGLCTAASIDIIEEFKNSAVIVYISSKDDSDWEKTPNIVKKSIVSPQAGKYIPKAIVMNSDNKKVYAIIPYERDRNKRKENLHEINMAIRNKRILKIFGLTTG